MIIDSHCHAWSTWPYGPVPDPESRGRVEQLLHEMDTAGVDQALVVSAQIDHNPENNAYVADQVARYPTRLFQVVDLDSEWSPNYHLPGGAARLRQIASRWPIAGFTHYINRNEDGEWLCSEDGLAMFQTAEELGLIASLSSYPHQQAAIQKVAARFPSVPILVHHMGYVRSGNGSLKESVDQVVQSSHIPNIYIKLSGFGYASETQWEYPYKDVEWIVKAEFDAFGPQRMAWGSDYPVVRFYMTYRQSLEAFRSHCSFITAEEKTWILGRTLESLLKRRLA